MLNIRLARLLFFALITLFCACRPTRTVKSGTDDAAISQKRKQIIAFAKDQVGADYKYAGQSPSTGFDCSGFTCYVLKEYKVKVSPASAVQAKEGKSVSLDRVQPGDLVFFGDSGKVTHVAMVVKRNKDGITCVHSTTSRGVIVENVSTSTYWKPKILFARDVISK
jgi:cell wall-associated NlpC family hydrolase